MFNTGSCLINKETIQIRFKPLTFDDLYIHPVGSSKTNYIEQQKPKYIPKQYFNEMENNYN